MADRKITDLTALAAGSQATGDLLTIVDVSEGAAADKNKKITVESLFKGIPGDVGIGTSSPQDALHIAVPSAVLRLEDTDTNHISTIQSTAAGLVLTADANNTVASSFLALSVDGSEKARIDSSGNVGIGTTPSFKLHIADASAPEFRIVDTTNNCTGFMRPTDSAVRLGVASNDPLLFFINGSERMQIDTSGRLLQGKSATKGSTGENIPTYCTETAGNNPNVLEIANNGTGSGSYSALVLSRSDSTSVNGHTAVDSGDKIGEVAFIGADGSDRFNTGAAIAAIAQSDFSANNCPTHLTFSTNGGSATASERMRIDSEGRVHAGGVGVRQLGIICSKSSDGSNPSNDGSQRHTLALGSTQTAALNVGPTIYFYGKTSNTTADYGFAGIQGCKGSTVPGDYTGHLRFFTQNLGGATNLSETCRITPDGLTFKGDTAAANALDDYEEGDWTPAMHSGGWTGFGIASAKYVKIGALVFVQCYVHTLTGSGTSNALELSGLPFASVGNGYAAGSADIGEGSVKGVYARTESSSNKITFFYPSENNSAGRVSLKGNQIGDAYIIVGLTYFTNS